MEANELIHKIDKARTKDDLDVLGIEHLDVDVDKRKTKEVVRAELLTLAEQRLDADKGRPEATTEPVAKEDANPTPRGRMARNKRTGRVMPWTAAMAKFPHMEEV